MVAERELVGTRCRELGLSEVSGVRHRQAVAGAILGIWGNFRRRGVN